MAPEFNLNFAGSDERTGFRLERLEVLNWGTFNKRVHVLDVGGFTVLLTGANGGGKSTLVDAFLTLMVPQRMTRHYNMASGTGRRARSEKTYVLGVWAEGLIAADSAVLEPKTLRKPGTPTVLLAVFRNLVTHQFVTVAQVLWMAEDVQHVYICTTDERSIVKDFHDLGDTAKVRQVLTKRGMEVFPTFDAYAETFCKRLHLAYPDGLGLFNEVVSVKETNDIAEFVRKHMLAKLTTIDDTLVSAQQQLEDLEKCARDIATAKRQLELLKPVADQYAALSDARAKLKDLEALLDKVPLFFAAIIVRQAEARLTQIASDEQALAEQVAQLIAKKRNLEAQYTTAIQALAGLPEARLLEQLNQQITDAKQQKEVKEAERKRFEQILRDCGFREVLRSPADFQALQVKVASKRYVLSGQRDDAIRKSSELRRQAEEKKKEQAERLRQILDLRNSRSHIRGEQLEIRNAVAHATNIPVARLPFVGELIEVKAEHAHQWRGPLESLLHSFGLSLLVTEEDYRAVVEYVDGHDLRGRLDFNRMDVLPVTLAGPKAADSGGSEAPPRVIAMLNIRPDHPLRGSVAEEIRRRFPHFCCDTTADFRKHDYAITRARLIRNGPVRHTKNDRPKEIDPENYVLGWNNTELIRTLEIRAAAAAEQAAKLDAQAAHYDQAKQEAEENLEGLGELLWFKHFEQINPETDAQKLLDLQKNRTELQRSNNRLRTLEAQRAGAQTELARTEEALSAANIRHGEINKERAAAEEALRKGSEQIKDQTFEPESIHEQLRPYLGKETISLSNATDLREKTRTTLYLAIRIHQTEVQNLVKALTSAMSDFLIAFSEFQTDFAAKDDRAIDYLALKKRITDEHLPELEARFRRLMSERVLQDMALLRNKLTESVDGYKGTIASLNESLREIEFNPGTYIELVAVDARASMITQFKNDMKACLPGAVNPTDETRRAAFEKIRDVLGRLRTDENWRKDVMDTRNWLDFRVDEKRKSDCQLIMPYGKTETRSGGQKAKFAFSVMAAAIAHHYGLLRMTAEERSFRFVVIDEIFGKTDEANATYALKLFRKFKLQLLVVCPFTAQARVVDDFVGSYHLVTNPDRNDSQIIRASLEQVKELQGATAS